MPITSSTPKEIAATIAAQLRETEPKPLGEIHRIVQRLGPETALAILQESQHLEAQGGLMLPDGSRRRTPGGVFFYLVKQRISTKDRLKIFYPLGQPAQPQESRPLVDGEVQKVKLTLIGRPGPTTEQPGYITTTLHLQRTPALPKGLPPFPAQPITYTVYIATKQWRNVAAALQDPEDVLVIEGVPAYDAAHQGIAVYATLATTKKLQAAKRQAQTQPRGG